MVTRNNMSAYLKSVTILELSACTSSSTCSSLRYTITVIALILLVVAAEDETCVRAGPQAATKQAHVLVLLLILLESVQSSYHMTRV
jgi:hypothetical protein